MLVIAFMIGAALGFVAGELDAVEQMLDIVHRYADSLGLPREGRPPLLMFLHRYEKKKGVSHVSGTNVSGDSHRGP